VGVRRRRRAEAECSRGEQRAHGATISSGEGCVSEEVRTLKGPDVRRILVTYAY
jgi:hypothetical protein